MCHFTYFTCDCEDEPPRPARTNKCLLARQGLECEQDGTLCSLLSEDCPMCLKRAAMQRQAEHKHRSLHVSNNQNGESSESTIEDVNANMSSGPVTTSGEVQTSAYLDPRTILAIANTQSSTDDTPREEPLPVPEWEVPTRCFTDPGFIRLDPWAADRIKLSLRAEMKRNSRFQDCIPKPRCPDPEDKENFNPEPRSRIREFLEFQQEFHRMRGDTRERKVNDPSFGSGDCGAFTVAYRFALAPCCEAKSRLKQLKRQSGAADKDEDYSRDTIRDDLCRSWF